MILSNECALLLLLEQVARFVCPSVLYPQVTLEKKSGKEKHHMVIRNEKLLLLHIYIYI